MPYALITGATGGIGQAFAKILASEGYDLVLCSKSEDKLSVLQHKLKNNDSVDLQIIKADLTLIESARRIFDFVRGSNITIDLLINNAGVGLYEGDALCQSPKGAEMLSINAAALAQLCELFLPGMIARDSGQILNIASTAAFRPYPLMPVYAATKAFVVSYTESLAVSLQRSNVQVSVFCPSATDTSFDEAAGAPESMINRKKADPTDTASRALKKMRKGKTVIFYDSYKSHLFNLSRFMPERLKFRLFRKNISRSMS